MKKVLILILIILLGVMCYNTIIDGYEIAGFSVLGMGEIITENDKLDVAIDEAEQLKETTYVSTLGTISTAAKQLGSTKKTYEELVAYSSDQEIIDAAKSERYDVEVLWTRIGNHATANGIVPKMEIVSSSNNTPNANDLKFTITGNYIAITDFIRDIEEDIKLGFAIEEFELVPVASGDGTQLQATFRVRDIFINTNTITSIITSNPIGDLEDEEVVEKQTENNTTNNTKNNANTNSEQ